MIREILALLLTVSATTAGIAPTLAHEDFRVIGTVTKHEASAIEVRSRDGKIASIKVDKQTAISRDNQPAAAADLAVGLSVVVDAYGDSHDDLLALEIRIVPPIATP